MVALTWDAVGTRSYETGVDHGALYVYDKSQNKYGTGVAWSGLTTVTESPSGAEATPLYADNIKYLNLRSAEELSATIEAYSYPDEFGKCDGTAEPAPGVQVGQQERSVFGLVYRTKKGTDTDPEKGYKIHVIYGATASPSEKAYTTVSDSPEAITFSWEVNTTPVPVKNLKPTSIVIIDSTKVSPENMKKITGALYGTDGTEPKLLMPDEIVTLVDAGVVGP